MSVLKTLGVGMYYRLRRISKAMKNWKKFGVIIFGSMVISTSVVPNLVDAASSLHMSIYPTNSTITLGSDKVYTAQVFNGVTNVTADSTVTWLASDGTSTVATGTGASWVFRPAKSGTFTINAQAKYSNLPIVWADTKATLTVTGTENTAYVVAANQLTSGNRIKVGESKVYNAVASYGTATVTSASQYGWVVTKNSQTVASNGTGISYTFTPTVAGTYSVKVRGSYTAPSAIKTAWSNELTLIVDPVTPPPPATNLHASLYPTYSEITLGSNKTYTAQAYNGTTNVTSNTVFTWKTVKGTQTIETKTTALGVDVYTFRPTTAGTFTITVTAKYNNVTANGDTPAQLLVKDVQDNRQYLVSMTPAGTQNGNIGVAKSYLAKAVYGDAVVTDASTFGWEVTNAGGQTVSSTGTTKNFSFTPTSAGTYRIRVRGVYYTTTGIQKTAWSDYGTLIVIPEGAVCKTITIAQPTNPIYVGETRVISWSAKNSDGTTVAANKVGWTLTGGGTWNPTSGVFNATQTGDYTLTGYCVDNTSIQKTVTLQVRNRIVPPNETCQLVNVIPSTLYLEKNQSMVIDYTSSTNYGNPIPTSNLVWSSTGGSFDSNTRRYTATVTGDYTVSVQCRTNSVVRDSVNIHVSDVIINQEYLTSTTISADRNPICLNESTNLSAQAKNNIGQDITNATYTWEWLSGAGYLAGDRNSQYGARFVATNSTGYGRVKVTASWNGQVASNEMTISVYDCSNPNYNQYFIDGYIMTVTDDGKPVCAGSVLNYTIVLTNRFNTVHGVRLSTSLPLGVTFMSASSQTDGPSITGRTVTWNPGTLTQGQSVTLNIKVKVNDDIRSGTNLRLSAFIQADEKPEGFYLTSGDLVVRCGGTTPKNPLPSTGMEIWLLAGLAVVSFGLSFLTYRWFDRRMMSRI